MENKERTTAKLICRAYDLMDSYTLGTALEKRRDIAEMRKILYAHVDNGGLVEGIFADLDKVCAAELAKGWDKSGYAYVSPDPYSQEAAEAHIAAVKSFLSKSHEEDIEGLIKDGRVYREPSISTHPVVYSIMDSLSSLPIKDRVSILETVRGKLMGELQDDISIAQSQLVDKDTKRELLISHINDLETLLKEMK